MGLAPTGRVFQTEQQAQDAVALLTRSKLAEDCVTLMLASEAGSKSSAEVAKDIVARHPAWVPPNHARFYAQRIRDGESLVLVDPPYGHEKKVAELLDGCEPIKISLPEADRAPISATPFSDWLGFRTLSHGRIFDGEEGSFLSWLSNGGVKGASSGFSLSRLFFMPMLTRSSTPLSSLLGFKTQSGGPGSSDKSFGMPKLIDNPTPLSSKVGMKTLVAAKGSGDSSFGLPLATKSSTPLSSMLGLPLLTGKTATPRSTLSTSTPVAGTPPPATPQTHESAPPAP